MKQSRFYKCQGLVVASVAVLALGLSGCNSEVDRLVGEGHSQAYAEGHVDGCRSGATGITKRHDTRYRNDAEYKEAWDKAYKSCGTDGGQEPAAEKAKAATSDAVPASDAAANKAGGAEPAKD